MSLLKGAALRLNRRLPEGVRVGGHRSGAGGVSTLEGSLAPKTKTRLPLSLVSLAPKSTAQRAAHGDR
jgi:hypothetical protein